MLCNFERLSGLSCQTVFQRTRTPLDVHFGCHLNVNLSQFSVSRIAYFIVELTSISGRRVCLVVHDFTSGTLTL